MKAHFRTIALSLGFLSAGFVAPAPEPSPPPAPSRLAIQLRDAARKTYEVTWLNYRENRSGGEVLYRWSKRWLEAERNLTKQPDLRLGAAQAHWARMRELERLVKNLQQSKLSTIDEVSAAEYYRVEAEIWIARLKDDAVGR